MSDIQQLAQKIEEECIKRELDFRTYEGYDYFSKSECEIILSDYFKQLESENARLKEQNKQLLEKFKQLELSGNSGKLGWQSAETLPTGRDYGSLYCIKCERDTGDIVFVDRHIRDFNKTKMQIEYLVGNGYKNLKYLKLPE